MVTTKTSGTGRKTSTRKKKTATGAPAGKKTSGTATPQGELEVGAGEPGSLESRLVAPLAELERVLGEVRRRDWLNPSSWDWPRLPEMPSLFEHRVPSVDVVEKEKEIVVRAEVPGVDRDDLEVSVADRTLTIRGETRHEEEHDEGDLHRREIRTGAFSRVVTLPADVDPGKARARYRDGVVTLKLPKVRSSRRKTISVD